jgi:GNAT superfamily N-acetyltransferase
MSALSEGFTAYDEMAFFTDSTTRYVKRRLVEGAQVCVAQVLTDRNGLYLWQIDLLEGSRGRGTGSRLLAHLCAEADRRGLRFRLTAVGQTPGETARLVRWYARHGFAVQDWDAAGGCRMNRQPR